MQLELPRLEAAPILLRTELGDPDAYFESLCAANPDLRIERSADGEIQVMAPAGFESGVLNGRITGQLSIWADKDGRGTAADSSTGYRLPNGANRSPDASWILKSRLEPISAEERSGFLPLCPDFVIELRSRHDRLKALRTKMGEWLAQGAQLGWLVDPKKRSISIYKPGQAVKVLVDADQVKGEGPVEGFVLELSEIWHGQ